MPRRQGQRGEVTTLYSLSFLYLLITWFPQGTQRNQCLHSRHAILQKGTLSAASSFESSSPVCHPTKQTEQGPQVRSRPVGTDLIPNCPQRHSQHKSACHWPHTHHCPCPLVSNTIPSRQEARVEAGPQQKWRGSLHRSRQLFGPTEYRNCLSLSLFFKLQTGIGQRREAPNHPSPLKAV